MSRTFEGARVDMSALAGSLHAGDELSIHTVRRADLKRLRGLETLPLATLALRWLSAEDLTTIPLPSSLKTLRLWHSSKLSSLAGISQAPELTEVILRGNGPLVDAMPLRSLRNLRTLAIEGDPPTQQKIQTLDFLEGLPLHRLSLRAVEGATLDLGPVARLPRLQYLDLNGPDFAPSELAKVAAAKPWFLRQLMDLPVCSIAGQTCPECGGPQKELFLRSVKGLWCPLCSAAELDQKLNGFLKLVTAARA